MSTRRRTADADHIARIASDSEYQERARLLQHRWRVRRGLDVGLHRGRPLGSRLAMPLAETSLANFLTKAAQSTVRAEVDAASESGKLYKRPRIFDDLLSSQPLCFNLFSDLRQNLQLATRVFATLHAKVGKVTAIEFEYSPGRGDARYTSDRSAFDVFVEYTSTDGAPSFLGIEVKYHERLRDKPSTHKRRYDQLADQMQVFVDPRPPALRRAPLQQIWRDHLLAGSLLLEGSKYRNGAFVFLYPEPNIHCQLAVAAYRDCLVRGAKEPTFLEWHLETVVAALRTAKAGAWIDEFASRYLDFESVE